MKDKNTPTPLDWLGLRFKTDFTKARPLGALLGVLLFLAALFVVAMFVATLWNFMRAALRLGPYADDTTGAAIRNIGLVVAAFLGAPFLVWRTYVAARQTDLQAEALFNDKINAATDLAARRQVTRVLKDKDGVETILTEWQDDLVTRAAAIDRLEGLAEERADIAPRIARMLSTYVQELSREHPAEEPPETASAKELRDWAFTLSAKKRPDMERAVQSLGRINPKDEAARAAFNPKNVNLRDCNLQGLSLAALNFQGAIFFGAMMQGAVLQVAQIQGADLGGAQMQGADLGFAEMSEDTDLTEADFRGASVRSVDDTTITQLAPFWAEIFADGTLLTQVPGKDWPDHWPREELDHQPWEPANSPFHQAWREWAATLDPPVTIAGD